MYCEKCKIEIEGNAETCPLCGGDVKGENPGYWAFPKPHVNYIPTTKFSLTYLILAGIAAIACGITNILVRPDFMWSIIVLVCLTYVYYMIRFTFISQGNFCGRVLGQAIGLTAVFFAIRIFIGGNHWIFITWLPIVYFVSDILLGVYMLTNISKARKNIIPLIVLCIFGLIPVASAYGLELSVKWPSISVSAISGAIIIVAIFFGRHIIIGELKRFFHR